MEWAKNILPSNGKAGWLLWQVRHPRKEFACQILSCGGFLAPINYASSRAEW